MAGSFFIQCQRGGNSISITQFLPNEEKTFERGVVLDGELSAFPRPLSLNMLPIDAGTKVRWENTQQRRGWVNRYDMDVTKLDDGIRFEGIDGAPLPEGQYDLELRIGEIPLVNRKQTISVPGSGIETVTFDAEPPTRGIRLNREVSEFDHDSIRILEHEKSRLDDVGAVEWLNDRPHQDRRKACLLNVLAKLAVVPSRAQRLNLSVHNVFQCEMDRIYCAVKPEFLESVDATFNKDATIHSTHKRLRARIPHARAEEFELVSYRERVAGSMQAVVAVPPADLDDTTHYVDLDIDKNNPSHDALRFLLHIGDLFDPNKTNHFDIRQTLVGGPSSDFVYYDVV